MTDNDIRTENDILTGSTGSGSPESGPQRAEALGPAAPVQDEIPGQHATPSQHFEPERPALYRPIGDRMLAGVASGLARYFDIDVTIVRVLLVVLAVAGGAGVPLYIAGWLLIPEEGAQQSIASELIASFQSRSR
jgi:phage shock protein PspC (stress-responsive transcriptional regulator)